MISLSAFNLGERAEWASYLSLFQAYIREVCCGDDDADEVMEHIASEAYRADILRVTSRARDRFHVCRILLDGACIGFCDHVCFPGENGKCIVGNLYLEPQYRNRGYGTQAYRLLEEELLRLGGQYIDLTSSPGAVSFYERKGFVKTADVSPENGEIVYRKTIAG